MGISQPNKLAYCCMNNLLIRIDGWFVRSTYDRKKEVNTERLVLPEYYVYSVRRFNLYDLTVTKIKKVVGSIFWPTYVIGVIDVQNDHVPFFVTEEKAKELNVLTQLYKRTDILLC